MLEEKYVFLILGWTAPLTVHIFEHNKLRGVRSLHSYQTLIERESIEDTVFEGMKWKKKCKKQLCSPLVVFVGAICLPKFSSDSKKWPFSFSCFSFTPQYLMNVVLWLLLLNFWKVVMQKPEHLVRFFHFSWIMKT